MNLTTTYADIIETIKKREDEIRKAYQFAIDRLQERIAELLKALKEAGK